MLFKYPVERGPVPHVLLIKGETLPGYLLHAIERLCAGIDEIVYDDHIHALLEQLDAGVAADVSGPAGNENCHDGPPFQSRRASG